MCPIDATVNCEKGFNVANMSQTCQEACGGYCCIGIGPYRVDPNSGGTTAPCGDFTGSVCKDGSCSGDAACLSAIIPSVVRSCNGTMACGLAGAGDTGYLGSVIDSCHGTRSCYGAGRYDRYGASRSPGFIGEIVNSCHEQASCLNAAESGYIKSIVNSCQGYLSCGYTARFGSIESIVKSCYGDSSCRNAARGGPVVGSGSSEIIGGYIKSIIKSCQEEESCRNAAQQGSIGGAGIFKACNGKEACLNLAKINITKDFNCTEGEQQVLPNCARCKGDFFECYFDYRNTGGKNCTGLQEVPYCPLLFFTYTYNITTGVKSCCNEDESCTNIGDDLPDDCILQKKNKKEKKNKPWGKGGE